ncbi:VOC family protein [Parahaliea mediterranea]|uniref:VOC family protein n=1 Tax=Parahaliea mediterranea TaxID=651086 RepID=A0A939DEY1_9GAMM|nr:VOC family protein [Parahaliea mediterranea]MBN7797030.1 VOC family protein [Parahaliea mediterranea]
MTTVRWIAAGLAAALLASCAAIQFSLPGVAQDGDGRHLPGKVVWHDLLTDTPEQTRAFYGELLGWEFEELPLGNTNYTLIRHRGRAIGGMVDQNRLPTTADVSQWVVVISVADVERAVAAVAAAGGAVITAPTSLGERGDIAVVADNQGAVMALLQTRDGDPPDPGEATTTGDFLWDELWSANPAAARDFYRAAVGYTTQERQLGSGGQQLDYHILSTGGRPRAGLRERPRVDIPPTWVSYLRVADAGQLDDILSRVEALGGRVLVPATDRPAGGRVALIAGPSGAGIALQTWSDSQTLAEAGP